MLAVTCASLFVIISVHACCCTCAHLCKFSSTPEQICCCIRATLSHRCMLYVTAVQFWSDICSLAVVLFAHVGCLHVCTGNATASNAVFDFADQEDSSQSGRQSQTSDVSTTEGPSGLLIKPHNQSASMNGDGLNGNESNGPGAVYGGGIPQSQAFHVCEGLCVYPGPCVLRAYTYIGVCMGVDQKQTRPFWSFFFMVQPCTPHPTPSYPHTAEAKRVFELGSGHRGADSAGLRTRTPPPPPPKRPSANRNLLKSRLQVHGRQRHLALHEHQRRPKEIFVHLHPNPNTNTR